MIIAGGQNDAPVLLHVRAHMNDDPDERGRQGDRAAHRAKVNNAPSRVSCGIHLIEVATIWSRYPVNQGDRHDTRHSISTPSLSAQCGARSSRSSVIPDLPWPWPSLPESTVPAAMDLPSSLPTMPAPMRSPFPCASRPSGTHPGGTCLRSPHGGYHDHRLSAIGCGGTSPEIRGASRSASPSG